MKRLALVLLLLAVPLLARADWTTERRPGVVVGEGMPAVLAGPQGLPAPALDMAVIRMDNEVVDAHTLVTGPTFLFYYSASCPHCQHVAPELAELARHLAGRINFVGIASGSNSLSELREFTDTYKLPFTSYKDFMRTFARKNNATSTPQVLLVQPKEGGGFETLGEWRPFAGGMGLLAELRARTLLGEDPWQSFRAGEWHGAQACGACHASELRSWGLTHHSIAYWTLYDRKEAENPECVGCHVTGWGQPDGFTSGDHGSFLADVTCEACHGPGGPHVPGAARPPPASASCVGCHDAKHSVRFSVERAVPHIDHFRDEAFDPAKFAAAREALVDGRAPRPLTAFPEGANLGDAACVECHKKESKSFQKDPHASAMKTLKSRNAQKDVTCVGCHATAKVTPPTTAADFHPGGVGCESCHGPGEQHVAAGGGKENIVGLGDSCPVCIVEAICTQCHTPEQDPDWNLETALEAVGHK